MTTFEVIKTEPSVGVCVSQSGCQCVNALTAEPIDIRSQNLVQGLTLIMLMISWATLIVKVIGQRSRSLGQKSWLLISGLCARIQNVMSLYDAQCHSLTSWCYTGSASGRYRNTLVFFSLKSVLFPMQCWFFDVSGNTCLRNPDENLMFLEGLEGLLTLDLSSNILDGALQEDALQWQAKLEVNILHC